MRDQLDLQKELRRAQADLARERSRSALYSRMSGVDAELRRQQKAARVKDAQDRVAQARKALTEHRQTLGQMEQQAASSGARIRGALRLDKPRGGADGDDLPALIESLRASEFSDPVLELIEQEAAQVARPMPPWHYCEAAAYVHLRSRYNGSMQRLADFLRISPSWCYRRYDRAMYRSRCLSLELGAAGREPDSALKRWRHFKLCRIPDRLPLNFGAKDLYSR